MAVQYEIMNGIRTGNTILVAGTLVSTGANSLTFRYRVPLGMEVELANAYLYHNNGANVVWTAAYGLPEVGDTEAGVTNTSLFNFYRDEAMATGVYKLMDLSKGKMIRFADRAFIHTGCAVTAGSKTAIFIGLFNVIRDKKESEFIGDSVRAF